MSRIALTAALTALALAAAPTAYAGDSPNPTAQMQAAEQTLQSWTSDTVRDENASPELRKAAQDSLEQTISADDAAWILPMIGDWQVPTDSRVWAARVAAEQELPGAAQALKASQGDELYAVRSQVNRSLAQLQGVGVACRVACTMPPVLGL